MGLNVFPRRNHWPHASIPAVPVPTSAGLPVYWKSLCIMSVPIKTDGLHNAAFNLYEFYSVLYSARFIVNTGQWEKVD